MSNMKHSQIYAVKCAIFNMNHQINSSSPSSLIKNKWIFLSTAYGLLLFAFVLKAGANSENSGSAEQQINQPAIYSEMLNEPLPKDGLLVDVNPPWLHFRVPILDGTEKGKAEARTKREVAQHRLYFFKLSQDPAVEKNVIASQPKRWSFFNPYQKLSNGIWYWKYGMASDDEPVDIKWSQKTYSFKITGTERLAVYPTPQDLFQALKARPLPHILMRHEDIGKLLPENHPEIKAGLMKDCEARLKKPLDAKIIIDESTYPKGLPEARKARYYQMNALAQYKEINKQVQALLRAYLLTGDERFKKAGLESFWNLDHEYHTTMMKYSAKSGYPDDFVLEGHVKTMTMVLDGFYDDLTSEQRTSLIDYLFKVKKEGYLGFDKQLEFSEHTVYKAHLWQAGVQTLLLSSIVLAPYKAEAKTWLEYAYELWLYRNPAGSRNDGGWHQGNGYFGADERQLIQTPYVLRDLTGYDFFNHPWYQNVAKYLNYSSTKGNPGLAFGDGVGYNGAAQPNLIETLAYLHPENEWNLWRFKSSDRIDDKKFVSSLGENEAAWTLLLLWKDNLKPGLSKVKPPESSAAVFPDIGYVSMETDMTNAADNLLLNFRACPFGAINHGHPAQNAFNVAFGGQPLFWRTGYYHAQDEHKETSYKNTRAHNTVLVNGIGQADNVSGFGWMARFAMGEQISYALGDASKAYAGQKDNPGVTRFRRHVVMLRPNYIVVYDELEAKQPVIWSSLLHSLEKIEPAGSNAIRTHNDHAVATATLFCGNPMKTTITNRFFVPALDVRGEQGNGAKEYPDQWHASFTTANPVSAVRFLTVIDVTPTTNSKMEVKSIEAVGTGLVKIQVVDYTISAQLDASQPSFLEVHNRNDTCALVTGQAARQLTLAGETRTAKVSGSTLLMEKQTNKPDVFVEKTDQLPDVMIYGNTY